MQKQLDWFKRQLFGQKSEKRLEMDTSHQADLLAALDIPQTPAEPAPQETITYQRRKKSHDD